MGYKDQKNVSDGHTRMTLKFNYILPLSHFHTHSHMQIDLSDWFTRGKYGYIHTAVEYCSVILASQIHSDDHNLWLKWLPDNWGVRTRSVSLSDMWGMNRTTVENLYVSCHCCALEHRKCKISIWSRTWCVFSTIIWQLLTVGKKTFCSYGRYGYRRVYYRLKIWVSKVLFEGNAFFLISKDISKDIYDAAKYFNFK